jgi:hypothetical protein
MVLLSFPFYLFLNFINLFYKIIFLIDEKNLSIWKYINIRGHFIILSILFILLINIKRIDFIICIWIIDEFIILLYKFYCDWKEKIKKTDFKNNNIKFYEIYISNTNFYCIEILNLLLFIEKNRINSILIFNFIDEIKVPKFKYNIILNEKIVKNINNFDKYRLCFWYYNEYGLNSFIIFSIINIFKQFEILEKTKLKYIDLKFINSDYFLSKYMRLIKLNNFIEYYIFYNIIEIIFVELKNVDKLFIDCEYLYNNIEIKDSNHIIIKHIQDRIINHILKKIKNK